MKKIISFLLIIVLLCSFAIAEEEDENSIASDKLYVIAKQLNGRASPSKKATVEAWFDKYDTVEATGRWSERCDWIEVYGGETGTVWCATQYLSEITEPVMYRNRSTSRVKIRKKPFTGRVNAYLTANKSVEITQIVNGWGKCKRGWIEMIYLEEDV